MSDDIKTTVNFEYDAGYCVGCGAHIGSAPFHMHGNWPGEHPMAPYCGKCGGTVKVGFVPSVTCQCPPKVKP